MRRRSPDASLPLRIDRPMPPAGLTERILAGVRRRTTERFEPPALDVVASSQGIVRIGFGRGRTEASGAAARRFAEQAREELAQYLAGERSFFTFALDLSGVAPFQRAVLDWTRAIPVGEVRPYGWVAARIGHPRAVRAVGTALGTNPVPLIVPCHRVIRSDGSIGNYGGGVPLKQWLLRLEREMPSFVGSTETRSVCRRGCEWERGMRETERVVFASADEARAVGYEPCDVCHPDTAG